MFPALYGKSTLFMPPLLFAQTNKQTNESWPSIRRWWCEVVAFHNIRGQNARCIVLRRKCLRTHDTRFKNVSCNTRKCLKEFAMKKEGEVVVGHAMFSLITCSSLIHCKVYDDLSANISCPSSPLLHIHS